MLHQVILISIYYIFLLAIRNQGRKCFHDKTQAILFSWPSTLEEVLVLTGGVHMRVEGPMSLC